MEFDGWISLICFIAHSAGKCKSMVDNFGATYLCSYSQFTLKIMMIREKVGGLDRI